MVTPSIRRWWKAPWLWAFLIVFYLLSPKMATSVVVDKMAARLYQAEVLDVLSARYTNNGNVVACLLLDMKRDGTHSRHQVELPVGPLSSPDHPAVKQRTSGVISDADDFSVVVDEAAMTEKCADVPQDTDIFTGPNKTYGRGSAYTPPEQPAFRAELYPGEFAWEIFYIAREPLRRVRLQKTMEQPEEWRDEHYIRFTFPQHQSPPRWWNAALLPPAILVDAVTGPFGWIAVVKQHG